MFIQTSTTPNPASLMFLPGEKVMEVRTAGDCLNMQLSSVMRSMLLPPYMVLCSIGWIMCLWCRGMSTCKSAQFPILCAVGQRAL